MRRYFEQLLETWEDFSCDPVELQDEGEDSTGAGEVVAICRMAGRARASGLELEALVQHHWTLRDGQLVRAGFFWHLAQPEE